MSDTIAVIFDFDETLAPDSTSSYLAGIGVAVEEFWTKKVQPLMNHTWDPIPAYLHMMIRESLARKAGNRITRASLLDWGENLEYFNGVTRLFNNLIAHANGIDSSVTVEFYIISSGIGDILRSTRIAKRFTDIWASEFSYNEQDEIEFPKNIVSFTDKTRFLFHIQKGIIGPEFRNKPFEVNKKVVEKDIRVPFNQMIYVGDGYTDIPCFSMLRKQGGVAIGVYSSEHRDKWGRAWSFVEDGRVSNLVPADYGRNSALLNSLHMAVESIARKINLRKRTYQG